MSGYPLLDWAALTLSLFNAFLLCWLGFTVILEADRRAAGVWLSADGLFLGAAFFIAHTAILRNGLDWASPLVNFWWKVGWWPLILSPLAWYCVILWYSGYWDTSESALHRRHAPFFGLILVLTACLLVWMIFANPLPDLNVRTSNMNGFHGLSILFPVYILLCILLALDAIMRPGPTARFLGNEARERARPWLQASTIVLLVVCLLAAFALSWGFKTFSSQYQARVINTFIMLPLTELDVIIQILICAAILLIGQAAMVYEVFSSIPLPRSGLKKRWQFSIITGGVMAVILSCTLLFMANPEVSYLIMIPLLTAALTIQNRLSGREQEMEINQLRTLARPYQMVERIFASSGHSDDTEDMVREFDLICRDLLRTEKAVLVPAGVLASFLPEQIIFPHSEAETRLPCTPPAIQKNDYTPQPVTCDGFRWAVPLVSPRGVDGWLFIGEHTDGGFYTREEITIAGAAVQRFMDSLAAAEVARRLVNLQQQKQTETRLLDQKSRQILHDDILPLLHTALLTDPHGPAAGQIIDAHRLISNLLREAPPPPPSEIARAGLFSAVTQLARNEAELNHARLELTIDDHARQAADTLPPDARETVYYAIRECLRNIGKHAGTIPEGQLKIKLSAFVDGMLAIVIENNGGEISRSDTEITSTGEGIRLHNAMLAVFGGGIHLDRPDTGHTRASIRLPLK